MGGLGAAKEIGGLDATAIAALDVAAIGGLDTAEAVLDADPMFAATSVVGLGAAAAMGGLAAAVVADELVAGVILVAAMMITH